LLQILYEASLVLEEKMQLFEKNFIPMMLKLSMLTSYKGDIMKSEGAQIRCLEQLHDLLHPKEKDLKGRQRAIHVAKVKNVIAIMIIRNSQVIHKQ
jgi:hypothetical protein